MKRFTLKGNSSQSSKVALKSQTRRIGLGLGGEDSGSEDESNHRKQIIDSVDESGVSIKGATRDKAITKSELVIAPVANKNWREEAYKRQGVSLPNDAKSEPKIHYGLNFPVKKSNSEVEENNDKSEGSLNGKSALQIPISKSINDYDDDDDLPEPVLTEEEVYHQDISSRPDAPDLAAYERVPVEEFGAALLRGMGWKGEYEEESSTESMTKRPAFLGLGAKPVPNGVDELGSWGVGSTKKSAKIEKTYIPLVKINKATGEKIEEDDEENEIKRASEKRSSTVKQEETKSGNHERDSDRYSRRSKRRDMSRDSNRDRSSRTGSSRDEWNSGSSYRSSRYKEEGRSTHDDDRRRGHRSSREDRERIRDDYSSSRQRSSRRD